MDNSQQLDAMRVEFDQLANLFIVLDVFTSPSELHGLLCGHLSCAGSFDEQAWLTTAAAYLERNDLDDPEVREVLLDVFAVTQLELAGTGFGLTLLLPNDDTELPLRAEHLGRWCLGFLAGLEASLSRSGFSEDLTEMLADLAEIANIENEFSEADDAAEEDFMQVTEYVRMAAIYAYSEIHAEQQPVNRGPADEPVLH